MTKFLAACILAILAAGAPASAQSFIVATDALKAAAGEQVFDIKGQGIGAIRGVTDETGQLSAIVSTGKAGPGNRNVLIIASELQPRDGGGWLASIPASSILDFPPYNPGRMLPLN